MAKKAEAIIIEDELPNAVGGDHILSDDLTAAVSAQAAQKAPSMDEVMAYWTPGREITMEVPACIKEHSVKCVHCDVMLPYIPVKDQAAPTLICDDCAK